MKVNISGVIKNNILSSQGGPQITGTLTVTVPERAITKEFSLEISVSKNEKSSFKFLIKHGETILIDISDPVDESIKNLEETEKEILALFYEVLHSAFSESFMDPHAAFVAKMLGAKISSETHVESENEVKEGYEEKVATLLSSIGASSAK